MRHRWVRLKAPEKKCCMDVYHGTGVVFGKAGRSLIAGLKHDLNGNHCLI